MNRPLQLFSALFLLTALLATQASASPHAKPIEKSTHILEHWATDQHLYIKGNLGLSQENLDSLEQWLDRNAANWTVLLSQSAEDETYTDARGHQYFGMDAVEHAMGKGLPALTTFNQIRHPDTDQTNGAFYILFLNERKFSYFASDSYESRGLGAKNWTGQLDAPAKKAMHNGGRIIDSVKDTIRIIDTRLAKTLADEKRFRQESALRQKHDRELVDQQIITAEDQMALLTTKLSEFKSHAQYIHGDIAKTDLTQLRVSLRNARDSWKDGHNDGAQKLVSDTRQKISFLLDELSQFQLNTPEVAALRDELITLPLHSWNVSGEEDLHEAQTHSRQAFNEHKKGNRSYREHFILANELKNDIIQKNKDAEAALVAENKESKRIEHNKQIAIGTGVGSSLLLLTLFGIRANRRRLPHRDKSEELLTQRESEMNSINDRFLNLLDRTNLVVGNHSDLDERGYTGHTLEKSKEALQLTDHAILISENVSQLIQKSESLTHPRNPFSKIRNAFSSTRYLRAIDLLDQDLSLDSQKTKKTKNTAKENSTEIEKLPVEIQLPHWKANMEKTINQAESHLDDIENAWSTLIPRCETIEKHLQQIESQKDKHQQLCAKNHHYLYAPSLFSDWLPHLRQTLEIGLDLGKGDPLSALASSSLKEDQTASTSDPYTHADIGPIIRAEEMAQEARTLLQLIKDFHQKKADDISTAVTHLEQRQIDTQWIDQNLTALSEEQNDLIALAQAQSISADLSEHGQKIETLHQQIIDARDLASRAHDETAQAIAISRQKIDRSREKISQSLALEGPAIDSLLNESTELSPSRQLDLARDQQQAAIANLNRGDINSTRNALTQADECINRASQLVTDTTEAAENYDLTRQSLIQTRDSLQKDLIPSKETILSLRELYTPESLLIQPNNNSLSDDNNEETADPTNGFIDLEPQNNQQLHGIKSLHDAPPYLEQSLKKIQHHLDQAQNNYQSGQLLNAARHLSDGHQLVNQSLSLTEIIASSKSSLESLSTENSALYAKASVIAEDLNKAASNPRTTQETLLHIATASARLEELRTQLPQHAVHPTYPQGNQDKLEELLTQLQTLQKLQKQDLELYDTLTESLPAAQKTLKEAHKLYTQAKKDKIPDSTPISESLSSIESLDTRLVELSDSINLEQNPHGNWSELHSDLLNIHSELSHAIITLREELRLAQEASACAALKTLDAPPSTLPTKPSNKATTEPPSALPGSLTPTPAKPSPKPAPVTPPSLPPNNAAATINTTG